MKILVTGGAGFLGSHLCSKLISQNNEVFCIDNLYTGSTANIKHLIGNPNFHFIIADISKTINFFSNIDQIYNLACPASPPHYQKNPVHTTKTSVLGIFQMLDLARETGAKILQASTSEVYGDPSVHPQTEDYWGNVNPIGIRACYDESKRVAETVCFDYLRQYDVDIKVVRIFNSLTKDQKVFFKYKNELYHRRFDECYNMINNDIQNVEVPCFDENKKIIWSKIINIIKHKVNKMGLKISLTWGKHVSVTEDHSLFTADNNGNPVEVFGRDLNVGDKIAVPLKINFPSEMMHEIDLLKLDLFYNYSTSVDKEIVLKNKQSIYKLINTDSRRKYSYFSRYVKHSYLPVKIAKSLNININDVFIRKDAKYKSKITDINDLLWVIGFFIAKGSYYNDDNTLIFSSNKKCLDILQNKLYNILGRTYKTTKLKYSETINDYYGSIRVNCKLLFDLFKVYFGLTESLSLNKDIPEKLLKLPLNQLNHLLHGYWCGDGNHDSKTTHTKIIFNTSSVVLVEKLSLIFSKYGIMPYIQEFYTTSGKNNVKYKSYRLHILGLNDTNILNLDKATQTMQRKVDNHIAWAKIRKIEKFEINDYVYDFSVPNYENFIGGFGQVLCHNTYGPNMNINDGRVISNFVVQALRNEDITMYGDGKQSRSFQYVDDLIRGLISLMNSKYHGPYNVGNPEEYTMLELASIIIEMIGSKSKIVWKDLPNDDPRRRKPNIYKAKKDLGWSPKVNIKDGLIKTIEYFRSII